MKDAAAQAFAKALEQNTKLVILSLSYNLITDTGIAKAVEGNTAISVIYLSNMFYFKLTR